jgi:oligosaccharide reducing-end xylanase
MRSRRATFAAILTAYVVLPGCTTTTDSLGYDDVKDAATEPPPNTGLRPLAPRTYPNPFRDVINKPQAEIDAKIQGAFDQLFHGDPDNEAVYRAVGDDEAQIRDVYHNDVRTEGQGLGMMIAVQLDKRDEFDKLWRYAKSTLRHADGSNEGYYRSFCDNVDGISSVACIDPYGMEQFAMALIFAHGRWDSTGAIDYEADALELLDVMLHKEDRNGGVMEDVTNVFDDETKLVFHEPKSSATTFTRPSIEIPAYYALWAEATGEAFWTQATDAGRAFTRQVSHETTGLMPVRAYLDGRPVVGGGWDAFRHEAYRTEVNLALDQIWHGDDSWVVEESDRLIAFFSGEGLMTYGKAYTLDGTVLDRTREIALVATNGAVAAISTRSDRVGFIQAVWDLQTPTGGARYYAGMVDLLALLVLGGQFRVY